MPLKGDGMVSGYDRSIVLSHSELLVLFYYLSVILGIFYLRCLLVFITIAYTIMKTIFYNCSFIRIKLTEYFCLFFFLVFSFWCWDRKQGLTHARQTLYHWATSQPWVFLSCCHILFELLKINFKLEYSFEFFSVDNHIPFLVVCSFICYLVIYLMELGFELRDSCFCCKALACNAGTVPL
jgi:hypothetical protein